MNTKLTTITTQYSKFNDNQVLTKKQLNQFLEYFEDQDHLSRISLSGVGIVCGFNIKYNSATKEINISKGVGITTDGDLLTLVEPKKTTNEQNVNSNFQLINNSLKTFTHYKGFNDDNVKYPPFFNEEVQIDLLELFSESEINLSDSSYKELNTLSDSELEDKVALLYLENYSKQGDLCTALDCDNQGIEQIAKLRVLLVSSANANSINSQDPIFNEHNWHKTYLSLPNIKVPRDILSNSNTKDYKSLKKYYFQLIKENETLNNLKNGLDIILQKFGEPTISPQISSVFNLSPSAIPTDVQYRYDLLKDLVETYNEIKDLLLHLNVECCPTIDSFPKHLFLGRLKETQTYYKSLRHRFYKSPILGQENTNLNKVKSLLKRVRFITLNYLESGKGEEIKITPSKLAGNLGEKAIPFYYKVLPSFLDFWSYNKFKNFNQTSNLSYHATSLSESLHVKNPLLYNLDEYNFLRIEGIQGKSYRDALDQVLNLKKEYGLNFEVKALSINPTTRSIDLGDYRCEFEDLEVLLNAWNTEQECILSSISKFVSGLSTKEAGKNVTVNDFTKANKTKNIAERNVEYLENRASLMVEKESHKSFPSGFIGSYKESVMESQIKSYSKKNAVNESLVNEVDTLGHVFLDVIKINPLGSENDIINLLRANMEEVLSTEEWTSKPEIRDFVLNDAIELITIAYVLSEKAPKTISEINPEKIKDYQITLTAVCQLANRLSENHKSIDLEITQKEILGILINRLSSLCCSGEKLTTLLKEMEKRIERILNHLKFSEFVKKHPGLRHYAGVPEGGTFVMVHLTDNSEDVVAYESVRMKLDFDKQPANNDKGKIHLWNDRVSANFLFTNKITIEILKQNHEIIPIGKTIDETVSNFADFLNNIWRIAGQSNKCKAKAIANTLIIDIIDQKIEKNTYYIQLNTNLSLLKNRIYFDSNEVVKRNITTKNTVIADFALPYMCCSDCTPVNFIVPKEPVSLSLPTSFICRNDSTTPIPFTVYPKDGEIKAVVEEGISSGVVLNDDGTYVFDANLMDSSLLGKAIQFTVNEEETNTVITIYEQPKPIITVLQDQFIYSEDGTNVKVFFKVEGEGINNNSQFSWNFGDNSPITQQIPINGMVDHTYNLPIEPNNSVIPKITVANELCAEEITLEEITFKKLEIDFNLTKNEVCFEANSNAIVTTYTLTPNTSIDVHGDSTGISINRTSKSIRLTSSFTRFNQAIQFKLNGNVNNSETLIVRKKPADLDFSFTPDKPRITKPNKNTTIKFNATNAANLLTSFPDSIFKWQFFDEDKQEIHDQLEGSSVHATINVPEQLVENYLIIATLSVSNNICNIKPISKEIIINISGQIEPQECNIQTINAINENREELPKLENLDAEIEEKVIKPTLNLFDKTVIPNIEKFIEGTNNKELPDLFIELIQNTSMAVLEAHNDSNELSLPLSKYLIAQVKLFYQILYCQEKISNEHTESIIVTIDGIVESIAQLANTRFDLGNPDPKKAAGSLRQFLIEYFNDSKVSDVVKNNMQELISIIIPIE